jgi:hypothetical protein
MNRQKTSSIHGSGNECQESRQMPIGLLEPFLSCKPAQIWDHRSNRDRGGHIEKGSLSDSVEETKLLDNRMERRRNGVFGI